MIRLIVVAMLLASTVARAQDGPATNGRPKLWVGWNLTRAECDRLRGKFVDGYCYGGDISALLSTAPDNSSAIPPGDSYIGMTMPAPTFQAQLDRIEAMVWAICANQRHIDGTAECPKETRP